MAELPIVEWILTLFRFIFKIHRPLPVPDEQMSLQSSSLISPTLPNDVVFEILSSLPVKTLLRLRAVCKSWRKLISSDPAFNRAQLRNSATAGAIKNAFLDCRCWSTFDPDFLEFGSTGNNRRQESTNLVENPRWRLILATDNFGGSTDGLICFYSAHEYGKDLEIFLSNPALKQCRVLPKSTPASKYTGTPRENIYLPPFAMVSLVHNASSDDYEVVKIFYLRQFWFYVAEIYNLRTNYWRPLDLENFPDPKNDDPVSHHLPFGDAVIYNGFPHWLARHDDVGTVALYALDLKQQKIRQISVLPPLWYRMSNIHLQLFEGCLSLYSFCFMDNKLELWVMKEEGENISWTKKVNIVVGNGLDLILNHRTTWVTRNLYAKMGKFVGRFRSKRYLQLLCLYDLEKQTVIGELSQDHDYFYLCPLKSYFHVVDYVPSLTSVVTMEY